MPGQELDLEAWLCELGLQRYVPAFLDAEVTPEILPELTETDLRELGLPLGPRRALLTAIRSLAGPPATPETMADPAGVASGPDTSPGATPSAGSSLSCSSTWSARPSCPPARPRGDA